MMLQSPRPSESCLIESPSLTHVRSTLRIGSRTKPDGRTVLCLDELGWPWREIKLASATSPHADRCSRVKLDIGGIYRTAWFMAHRIREAMRSDDTTPMGSGGGSVEADETFYGRDPNAPKSRMQIRNMNKIVSLVDRATGRATSVVVAENLSAATIGCILAGRIASEARLLTDEARFYKTPGKTFAAHVSVNHAAGEYVSKSDPTAHTNTVEGFFGIFKRGMRGIYQHCGSQHLHRYLSEFDFRYSNRSALGVNDAERALRAVRGAIGRRLMYKRCAVTA